METPQDRARQLGITTPAAAQTVPTSVQSVSSVPVSTTSKETHMSTDNTNTAKAIADLTAGYTIDMNAVLSTLMQQSELIKQLQFQMATQAAAVAQTQPQPTTAPVLAAEAPKPEKKPFSLGRPAKPYIPEKIEIYAPCKKDDAGKLTDSPNGTLCFFLGTNSKISLGWDEWQIVLEQFESGLVREMMAECAKTGQKQQWKL